MHIGRRHTRSYGFARNYVRKSDIFCLRGGSRVHVRPLSYLLAETALISERYDSLPSVYGNASVIHWLPIDRNRSSHDIHPLVINDKIGAQLQETVMRQLAFTTGLAVCLFVATAQAQTMKPHLEYATAATVVGGCLSLAQERGWNMAISVHDSAGDLVAFAAMDEALPAVTAVAQWKGKAAATFRFSTASMAQWDAPHVPTIATVGGGIPLFTDAGDALGGVGVSGATQEQDIECAEAGAHAAGLQTTR